MSFTIVDALDTLKIMGLEDEFDAGRAYVANIDESKFEEDMDVSFFETTIRVIGGLISAYDLSDDKIFIEKAAALADRLIFAFKTNTGLPSKKKVL
jgi:mannosyl-oligosaccharide alpha-1,2-mannosidase